MEDQSPRDLLRHFDDLEDPRMERTRRHRLTIKDATRGPVVWQYKSVLVHLSEADEHGTATPKMSAQVIEWNCRRRLQVSNVHFTIVKAGGGTATGITTPRKPGTL